VDARVEMELESVLGEVTRRGISEIFIIINLSKLD